MIFKPCFICHGKGHHLSNSQLDKLKEKCWDDKRKRINWGRLERILSEPPLVCELCHGNKEIIYPS